MLRCWDSDPEDRPSFTKIAHTISKSLQMMSDYLDLSLLATPAPQDDHRGLLMVNENKIDQLKALYVLFLLS